MSFRRLLVWMWLLGLAAGGAAAEERGSLTGRVLDASTKQPLENAQVSILGNSRGDLTDAEGAFLIDALPEDLYKLEISFVGYQHHIETDARVVRGKSTRIPDIELVPAVIQLEAVSVRTDLFSEGRADVVSNYSYSREEIRRAPGASGDVFRAMETLPGVTTSGGEFAAFSVRGGSPKDNVILLDNMPIGRVTHFNGGGTEEEEAQGGRFSVFAPGLIEEANFQAGGFSPEYGGKFSSLLDLKLKEGNPDDATIDARVDILGAEFNYDGPLPGLRRSGLVVSARHQDFTRILELTGQEEFGSPSFTDLIVKATTELGPRHKVSLLALHAPEWFDRTTQDVLEGDFEPTDVIALDDEKSLLGLNWRFLSSERSFLRTSLYASRTDGLIIGGRAWPAEGVPLDGATNRSQVRSRETFRFERGAGELGGRSVFTYLPSRDTELNLGFEAVRTTFDESFVISGADTVYVFDSNDYRAGPDQRYLLLQPAEVNYAFDEARTLAATFANLRFSPFAGSSAQIGLRHDYNPFNRAHYLAPRGGLGLSLSPRTSLRLAVGVYHQTPEFRVLVADPANNFDLENETAYHYILGLTRYLAADLKLTAEAYYKALDNLIVQPDRTVSRRTNQADGHAAGIDLSLIKKLVDRAYGQINYSYAVSERDDHDGRGAYDSDFNQPHIFSILAGYEFNQSWTLSAKWRYASGRPKDRYVVHRDVLGDPEFLRFSKEIVGNNDQRLDPFHTLNVRADYRRQLGRVALVGFLDVVNLYNYLNVNEERFNELNGTVDEQGFRILPTMGVKLEF